MAEETSIVRSELSDEQQLAIPLVAAGEDAANVAKAAGVTPQMVYRWWRQPAFRAALNEHHERAAEATQDQLRALAGKAVEALAGGIADEDPKIRIQAAVHILKTVGQYGQRLPRIGPTTPEDVVREEEIRRQGEEQDRKQREFLASL